MLAEKNATVIMACRNAEKATAAANNIRAVVPHADLRMIPLDLSNLTSVRKFAARVSAEYDHIDLLLNNAGVMMTPFEKTADGFEMQFGTNHLGHFLLTGLLLPLLDKAPAPRVVSLSSLAYRVGKIDLGNLNAEKGYSRLGAYSQSKLACLMFALELQRRLAKRGSRTLSLAAHPGASRSDLGRHSLLLTILVKLVTQPTDAGALPTLRAALDSAARGGEYFGPGKVFGMRGPALRETPSKRALDANVGALLWRASEELVGYSYP
jgi:NAD(P)-dependent dehydrogenase (short-subunit alcohol dehydrogenase family)